MSEASIQQAIRLEASRHGVLLFRNNVGAATDVSGRVIRYGLGNDSKAINDRSKSSDLIGIWPMLVTQQMVGQVVGVFTAIECKRPGWKFSPNDDRAAAQAVFGEMVKKHGGLFMFATDTRDVFK